MVEYRTRRLWHQGISTLIGSIAWIINSQASAQIVGDRTLPHNSLITIEGNRLTINGGTIAGNNLFHSFQEFSVPAGGEAYFNNTTNIANIISRITGDKITSIDGLIRANGTANLFLLNPNGIIFGPNAKLDLGGSFIGTTANSIEFSQGDRFSATTPNAPPLLTVNVPTGLQLGKDSGIIQVTGRGHDLQFSTELIGLVNDAEISDRGLQVKPGNTLALVGGDLLFDGGKVIVESGRIELGSVRQGNVSLKENPAGWELGYEDVGEYGNIEMRSQSLIEAVPFLPSDPSTIFSGVDPGESTSIIVRGDRLQMRDVSLILSQSLGLQPSGHININTAQSIELTGINPERTIRGGIASTIIGTGQGGEISISTSKLVIQENGGIASFNIGAANGGNVTVNAWEQVQMIGASLEDPAAMSSITTTTLGSGDAGDITLLTGTLRLHNGANIISTTDGSGKGGDVTVNATELIELIGVGSNFVPSSLSASTIDAGNAGNLTIDTGKLIVRDGGRIDSSTIASGSAGNVTINASEYVEISGTVPGSVNPSLIISSANLVDETLRDFFGLFDELSGKSGNITINAPRLSVSDGAEVTVRNDGTGDAGNLRIMGGNIFLDSEGSVSASTESGQGGNITLEVANSLQLRNQSQISAEAGGMGNGGNLTINANTVVALENSDIIANAVAGAGGNIRISTSGIFGTQFRPQLTPESDITASSQFGVSGTVNITTPEVDASAAVVELSDSVIDPNQQIVSGCDAAEPNTFIITGRGGLPADPTQTILGTTVWQDWQDYTRASPGNVQQGDRSRIENPIGQQKPSAPQGVVEATGWIKHPNGTVELVAQRPEPGSPQNWQPTVDCAEKSAMLQTLH